MDRRLEQALADLDTGDALGIIGSIMSHRAALNLAVAVAAYGDGVFPPDDLDALEQAMWDSLDAFLAILPDTSVYTADDPTIRVQ